MNQCEGRDVGHELSCGSAVWSQFRGWVWDRVLVLGFMAGGRLENWWRVQCMEVGFDDRCCGEKKGCVIKMVGLQGIIDEVS